MTFYQQARRLMDLRIYLILGVLVIAAVMASFGERILRQFVNTCDAPPAYNADVPQELRDQIDRLHEQGLLFCSDSIDGLVNMDEPVYWSTDGVSSLLFFQADDLSDLGVVRYGYGKSATDAFIPVTTGAAPPAGAREDVAGRAALTNQAPEGSSYFYRLQGAPADDDNVVTVTIRGEAEPQPGLSGRDAFRDLEMLWDRIRGAGEEVGDTRVQVSMPVLSELWDHAAARDVNPQFAADDGRASVATLRDAALTEPVVYQTVSGPLGTTVWFAGVISGTNPALLLVPDGEPGQQIEPIAQSSWLVVTSDDVLEHFAFDHLQSGTVFEASYWHESRDQGSKPPDYKWPVTVP